MRLHLDGLAHGGDAVGRDRGRVWFVPGGAPGEVVVVAPVEERPSYVRGRIVELVSPSPERVSPACSHFQTCGGCQWQHLRYEAQLREKHALLSAALRRVTTLPIPEPIAHPEPYGYRVRAELHVVERGDGRRCGFRAARSHEVVEPTMCPVLAPRLWALVRELSRLVATVPLAVVGRYELHLGDEGAALCAHVGKGEGQAALRWLGRVLEELPGLLGCVVLDEGRVRYTLREGAVQRDGLRYSAGVFGQGHQHLSSALVSAVLGFARGRNASVLELFAGAGLFSVPLGRVARRLVTAEENPIACDDARHNLEAAGVRAEVLTGAARPTLRRLLEARSRFDVVVLDPPRKGAEEEVPTLCDLAPRRIVYVSCDPMTLARDVLAMKPRGYSLQKLCSFDLFPQTSHLEVVALLERQGMLE